MNPLVQTDTTSKSAYISGNVVHAKGTFYYKLGPIEGLSVQIGNIYGVISIFRRRHKHFLLEGLRICGIKS